MSRFVPGLMYSGSFLDFFLDAITKRTPANTHESQLKRGAVTRMSSSRQQLLFCFAAYDILHRGDDL